MERDSKAEKIDLLIEFEKLMDISDHENIKILQKCLEKIFGISRLVSDKKSKDYSNFLKSFEKIFHKLKTEITQT